MSVFYLFQDSSTAITMRPEWDMEETPTKNQSVTRTPAGALYIYTFGSYSSFKVPLMFVTSADRLRVTSWWSANTPLFFMQASGTPTSVYIANDRHPLPKRVKPYIDRWQGVLELESR